MSRSKVTCRNEIQSVIKILASIHLVLSILWGLIDLLGGISIVGDPMSGETKDFIADAYAELDTETEGQAKAFGFSLAVVSILLLLLRIYLFHLISTGMKKRNYIKCRIWFITYAALEIYNVIGVIHSAKIGNIVDVVIWCVLAPLNVFLLLIGFMYLRELKREFFLAVI